jgi:hypothetical protein
MISLHGSIFYALNRFSDEEHSKINSISNSCTTEFTRVVACYCADHSGRAVYGISLAQTLGSWVRITLET